MLYKISSHGAKPHFTNNYLIAQLVAKDLENRSGFYNVEIYVVDEERVSTVKIPLFNPFGNNTIIPLSDLKISVQDREWQWILDKMPSFIEKSKFLKRNYVKLYGSHSILCLSWSQKDELISFIKQYQVYVKESSY